MNKSLAPETSPKVRFKKREGALTTKEILDGLTEAMLHQNDVNIAILEVLTEISEKKDKSLDLADLISQISTLINLSRLLIERYTEVHE